MRGMRTDTRHVLRGGVIVAAFAAFLLLTIALASAQEPPRLHFSDPGPGEPVIFEGPAGASQMATMVLEPGSNFIGWVGETIPVSQLFDEIPRLNAVWAWDARVDKWIVARRGVPDRLSRLGWVTPGMGLQLQLNGSEPFVWWRSAAPARGLVRLRAGWNLVAWSGLDGMAIEDVAKGIGWSLREIWLWDSLNQQWKMWLSPPRSVQIAGPYSDGGQFGAAPPRSSSVWRGEALWINVARAVNWLQPTGLLPRLVFPGGASEQLQQEVRGDLEAVLAFFADRYGIQADPDFSVYIAKDVEALIQAYRDEGQDVSDTWAASLRDLWDRAGGWAGGRIVAKQSSWVSEPSTPSWPNEPPTPSWPDEPPLPSPSAEPSPSEIASGRYTLTHEYFHIIQHQMSDVGANRWLVEGTATWAESEHRVVDGSGVWADLREWHRSVIAIDTPTLRSTENGNSNWEYTLGWLATDLLINRNDTDSWVEFWRRLSPTEVGPHHRWLAEIDWRTAFYETFGTTVERFYADDFYLLRAGVLAQQPPTPSLPNSYSGPKIHGRVTEASGAPATGLIVNAIKIEGEATVGLNQGTETENDGTFAVAAPQDGHYRISVEIDDNCTRYYSDGALIWDQGQAGAINVSGSDVRGINVRLPADVCTPRIRIQGWLVDVDGGPLAGIAVNACPVPHNDPSLPPTPCRETLTKHDGSFAVPVYKAGAHYLRLDLVPDECSVYYRSSGASASEDDATWIHVTDAGAWVGTVQLSSDLCRWQISGRVVRADGRLVRDAQTLLCREVNGSCGQSQSTELDDNGLFVIAVPTDGRYRVTVEFRSGCGIHIRSDDSTTNGQRPPTVRIDGRDAHLGLLELPAGACE